jgi:hypothetical protein
MRSSVDRSGQQQATERPTPVWLVVITALAAWIAALTLLLAVPARSAGVPVFRVVLPLLWALASALTFIPLQRRLEAPGLGWQGIFGWTLFGYVLAFIPAPGGSLLDLPELPSYLLLLLAVFYAVATAIVPLTWLPARRRIDDSYHQVRRARRQAYEVAALAVVTMGMAALRVLTPWGFGLLLLATILGEALLVSQIQTD